MSRPDRFRGPTKWAAVLAVVAASAGGAIFAGSQRPSPLTGLPLVVEPEGVHAEPSTQAAPPPAAAPAPAAGITPVVGPPAASSGKKINLNTATASQLELLPGIGPSLAQRILEHRASKGPFTSVDQLDDVSGIGPTRLRRLRPLISVD